MISIVRRLLDAIDGEQMLDDRLPLAEIEVASAIQRLEKEDVDLLRFVTRVTILVEEIAPELDRRIRG